jgi:predicted nucleic acid-binding protein
MIIADTGFWLALANRRDRIHEAAKTALEKLREPLITTWPVMTETCHLLAARMGVDSELTFVARAKAKAFEIFAIESRQLSRVHTLMDKYRDLPMDLADASLVLLAEELGTGRILSTDRRDFQTYRWKNRKPFRNLLADVLD